MILNTILDETEQDVLTATETEQSEDRKIPKRPAYISYFDPIVEYYTKFHNAQERLEKIKKAQKEEKKRLTESYRTTPN